MYIGGSGFCIAATSQTTNFRAVSLCVSTGALMEFQLRFYVFNPHIFYTSNDDSQSVLRAKKVRSDYFVISSGCYAAACQIVFRLPILLLHTAIFRKGILNFNIFFFNLGYLQSASRKLLSKLFDCLHVEWRCCPVTVLRI